MYKLKHNTNMSSFEHKQIIMRSNTRFLLSGKQVGIYYIDLLDTKKLLEITLVARKLITSDNIARA